LGGGKTVKQARFNPEILRQLLDEKKVTPYRLSIETGTGFTTMWQYLNGKSEPGSTKLYAIAKYLGVSMEYFMRELTDE
jgi:transcriptional regulator with XRE-family HTH domain